MDNVTISIMSFRGAGSVINHSHCIMRPPIDLDILPCLPVLWLSFNIRRKSGLCVKGTLAVRDNCLFHVIGYMSILHRHIQ